MASRTPKKDLTELVRSPGFTPAARDVAPLLELLAGDDEDQMSDVERALVRAGPTVVPIAAARVREAKAPLRGRIVRVIGKLVEVPEARDFLLAALHDEDAKTRRNAILGLGRVMREEAGAAACDAIEAALLAAWKDEPRVDHRRSIAQSLGKVGGAASREMLRGVSTDDAELRRIVDRALLQLDRGASREGASAIDPSLAPDAPRAIVFRCRAGIESILERELGPAWSARAAGRGVVEATLSGALGEIFRARTWLRVSFPLAAGKLAAKSDDAVAEAVIASLTSDEAYGVMRAFTRGAIRYRIAWESRGHGRALVFKVAQGVSARRPELVNDPTQTTWEASVLEQAGRIRVELEPRALVDPRFAYRQGDVPAASHPTLAAALARVAGARQDDVVWDPFAGSGSELVERAKLGPYARLLGTDTDARALDVARANLAAAGVSAELAQADAATYAPEGVTLIVTNPPMGRRVARGELVTLLDRFVDHAVRVLAPGGRIVWLSPLAERTRERFVAAGLKIGYRQMVDMGGFDAELQSAAKVR